MSKGRGAGSIPFSFTPLPRRLCAYEYYRSPQLLVFLVWIFSRVALEPRTFVFNGFIINLERGEFILGRKKCSEETGISEQTLRTYIKNLKAANFLQKATTKSTNKYTVYMLFLDSFGEATNHQINQSLTTSQPATNHKQEIEADIKESKPASSNQFLLFPVPLNTAASCAFEALSPQKKESLIALFQKRNSQSKIRHVSPWLLKCIQEGWYNDNSSESLQTIPGYIEQNRNLAIETAKKLEGHEEITCRARLDFLEIGKRREAQYHIFYHEMATIFNDQLDRLLRKLVR